MDRTPGMEETTMTTSHYWLPFFALSVSLCSCVIPKSVGDDPDSMDSAANMDDASESSDSAGAETSISGGSSTTSPGGTSTTSGGNASATSTGGGAVDPGACGLEPVPPGLPGWIYAFSCGESGSCGFEYVLPHQLDNYDEVAECLCAASGCGVPSGEVGEVGGGPGGTSSYDGVCDVEVVPNDGPGYFEAQCVCESCTITFEDVHPDSIEPLLEDGACDCLCLEAACGYSESGGGEVGGGSDVGGGDTGGSSTTGS